MATITGTSGNDTIRPSGVSAGVTGGVPSSVQDFIFGTAGSDTIDGGGGGDQVRYSNLTGAVTVNLLTGVVFKSTGADSLSNISDIVGTAFDDRIFPAARR
jgi:hypothetical protein